MSATAATTRSDRADEVDPRDRYRSWPALSYHYKMGWEEILRMPRWLRRIYIEELPRLQAESLSSAIDAAAFPHMKKQAQQRVQRRINRQVGERPQKLKDAPKDKVQALPIGIKFVPMEGGES